LANPSLGYDFQTESGVSPQTQVVSIDQAFPITRRLKLEKELSAQLVEAATLEVRDAERRFIAEASALAVKEAMLRQQLNLLKQHSALAQQLADFAKGRAEAGEVSMLDAKQVQMDLNRVRIESRLLEAEAATLLGQLKPMLGLTNAQPLEIKGPLPSLKLPAGSDGQQRPDRQLAEVKASAAKVESDLAKSRRTPDITAGLFAARERQGERTGFVGLRLSVPLPFWNRNEGEITEKTASAERARLESQALVLQINAEAGTALQEMQSHAGIVRETRDSLLPLAAEQVAAQQKAYEGGQAELLSVLRAQDQRLHIESTALDAERDFHLARVRYEAATGTQP
jgi:cobalt-zinc-cadmium efflux system outer membrane protein